MAKKASEPQSEHEKLASLLKITQQAVKDKQRARFGDDPELRMDTIPTGVLELDRILGGGWRRGRFGIIIGEASMGKTLVTQWTIKAFQEAGLTCGFVDPEKTFDGEWFGRTGVDVSKLIVLRPECTEQAFDVTCEWAKNGMDLIVIDSLAALVPKRRVESTLEEREVMGLSAQKISEGLAQVNNVNINSFILCTNQLRSKVGVVYGSPDTIPGGRAQRFYATYIVHVRRGGWIPDSKNREGYKVKMLTEKNKLHPPFMEGEVSFLFSGVIDTLGGLIDLAKEFEVLESKGGFYRWEGETVRGEANFKQYLESRPEIRARLEAAVKEAMEAEPDFGEEVLIEDLPEEVF